MSGFFHTKTEQTGLKMRGRPKQDRLEYVRAAFWARTVQIASRKKFSLLEREISPGSVKRRDGGGFKQPQAWNKYAEGKRRPIPPELGEKSAVFRAEILYPGTIEAYSSVTWDLLREPELQFSEKPKFSDRISPHVLNTLRRGDVEHFDSNRIQLSPDGYAYVSRIKHFDALGLMLMQWRGDAKKYLDVFQVYYARIWLIRASHWLFPFCMSRHLLLPLIEERVPELGQLSGPSDLSLAKTQERITSDVYYGLIFRRNSISFTK